MFFVKQYLYKKGGVQHMLYTKEFSQQEIVELAEIVCRLNPVELVTPINAAEAKEHWLDAALSTRHYENPVFIYDEQVLEETVAYRRVILEATNHLRNNTETETPLESAIMALILTRLREAFYVTNLAESILTKNDRWSGEVARKIYGFPTMRQIVRAYSISYGDKIQADLEPRFTEDERNQLLNMEFNADQIKYWFEAVIDQFGIDDWPVEVGDQYTAVDVRDKSSSGHPVVGIPATRKVNGIKLLGLVEHEIVSHLRGSANCRALIDLTLGYDSPLLPLVPIIAKSDDEFLYEGVAMCNEAQLNGEVALPKAFATIAINQAHLGGNFRSIAAVIADIRHDMGASWETAIKGAWTTTYRVMRGSTDTSMGRYCFPKDYAYLAGYDFARNLGSPYRDFASMKYEELEELVDYCELKPRYPYQDIVGLLKNKLLNPEDE